MSGELTAAQIDSVLLVGTSDEALVDAAFAELRDRRAIERQFSDSQVSRLKAVRRYEATGKRQATESGGGSLVRWSDYIAALDELLPYRTELLRIAADHDEAGDPFAVWERLAARSAQEDKL